MGALAPALVPAVSALLHPLSSLVLAYGIDLDAVRVRAVRLSPSGVPITYDATALQALAVSVAECASMSDGAELAAHPLYPAIATALAVGGAIYQSTRADGFNPEHVRAKKLAALESARAAQAAADAFEAAHDANGESL